MEPKILFALLAILNYGSCLEAEFGGRLQTERGPIQAAYDGNDLVLIFGGNDHWQQVYNKIEVYNITSRTIEEVATFPSPTGYQGPIALDSQGNVYYFVYSDYHSGASPVLWKINLHYSYTVTEVVTTLHPSLSSFNVVSDGAESVYILGGRYSDENEYTLRRMNMPTGDVEVIDTLPIILTGLSGVWYENSIYMFGGSQVHRYMPSTKKFETVAQLSGSMNSYTPVLVDDVVYTFGTTFPTPGIPPYTYTTFNLKTFEYGRHEVTHFPSNFYLQTGVVHVPKTGEFISFGGSAWFGSGKLTSIYRMHF